MPKYKVVRSPILEDQELPEVHQHNDIDQPSVDFSQVTGAAHSTLTGVTIDQHHARDHASRHAPGGGDALSLTSADVASIVTNETGSGLLVFATSPTLTTPIIGVATGTSLAVTGLLSSSSPTAGIGYATGAGGTVTQITSKATGVTLNTVCGTITMNGAALAADTTVSFVLTNSAIAANDVVVIVHDSIGTLGA